MTEFSDNCKGCPLPLWRGPFPLRASFNCLIVGRGLGVFKLSGFRGVPKNIGPQLAQEICLLLFMWILVYASVYRQIVVTNAGKKKAHKLKKILGTPAGCPWGGTSYGTENAHEVVQQTVLPHRKPHFWLQTGDLLADVQGFAAVYFRETDRKTAMLSGHWPGAPWTPGRPAGVQKFYVILSYVPFLLPTNNSAGFRKAWVGFL